MFGAFRDLIFVLELHVWAPNFEEFRFEKKIPEPAKNRVPGSRTGRVTRDPSNTTSTPWGGFEKLKALKNSSICIYALYYRELSIYIDKGGFVDISATINFPQKTEGCEEALFCIWGGFVDISATLIFQGGFGDTSATLIWIDISKGCEEVKIKFIIFAINSLWVKGRLVAKIYLT